MEYIPKVLQAVAGEDFTIYLYFSDGSVRRVIQHRQPVTEIIRVAHRLEHSPQLQQGLCIIQAAWDVSGDMDPCNCIDLDPIELYETCPVVVDPLEKAS